MVKKLILFVQLMMSYHHQMQFIKKQEILLLNHMLVIQNQLVNRTLYQNDFENISKAYAPVASVEKISVGIAIQTHFIN